ncbi:P pilus assembly protein [Vibrio ishigakensis]|uniref:P pilus assembly protein n=1 Tax=Vibrio ishigakensis TaxID=1481914 RepID=A0A0B8PJF6_9VIBR|nr:P pilus assembly protein [Vibrio ishigakensis]
MLRRLLTFIFLALWWITVVAKTFLFPVPLILDELSLGEINVYTDGNRIESVSTIDLINVLDGIVDDDTLSQLQKSESLSLSVSKLQEFGIRLNFEPTELIIKLELDSDNYKRQDIPYNQPFQNIKYSKSSFFAWHNIFNIVDDYIIFDDAGQNNFRGEWISSGNIGGAKWLNFEFSGFYSINSEEVDSDLPELYRGDARLFIDWPDVPFRGSMGDLVSIPKGHQPQLRLEG